MSDLLIRDIDPHLKQQLKSSARAHGRSLPEEARALLKQALLKRAEKRQMGTALVELIPKKYRGDVLIFEIPGDVSELPEFT
jgi:plasmid stability protein